MNKGRLIILISSAVVALTLWLLSPVSTGGSPPQQVTVFGMVQQQGVRSWTAGLTVEQLVLQAGGLAAFANPKRICIYNEWHGEPRYKDVLRCTADKLKGVEEALEWLWDTIELPGTSPDFNWMRSRPNVRVAGVDLSRGGEGATLQPGDVVVVPEQMVNF